MRALFFSHSGGLGGAEKSLLALIDELLELNVECFIVVPSAGPLLSEIKERKLPFTVIDYSWWCDQESLSSYRAMRRNWRSLTKLSEAQEELDHWNADIVFSNSITIPWGVIYSKLSHKPHVLCIREFGELDFQFQFFSGYQNSVQFLANNSDYVLTNSKATLKHFKDLLPGIKMEYVYPSIKIPSLDEIKTVGSAFLNKSALKLIVSGTLTEGKGQLDAIQATAIVSKNNIDTELILMGGQTDLPYLKRIQETVEELGIQKNVRLVGFLAHPLSYIEQADIVLICSRNEAFGRATLEAMALRKLVIGANSAGTKELIKNGENGFLYEVGNAKELAEKITYVHKNRGEMRTLKSNAYATYQKISKEGQTGKKTYNILVKTLLKTQMVPEGQGLKRSDQNSMVLLGLFSPGAHKSWSDLKRSLVMNKILLLLNPQTISQQLGFT